MASPFLATCRDDIQSLHAACSNISALVLGESDVAVRERPMMRFMETYLNQAGFGEGELELMMVNLVRRRAEILADPLLLGL
jgi:hypothetical protein